MFGLRGRRVQVYSDPNLSSLVQPGSNPANLASKTLYMAADSDSKNRTSPSNLVSPVCHFANVEYKGQKGTLLLENPRGDTLEVENLLEQVSLFEQQELSYHKNLIFETLALYTLQTMQVTKYEPPRGKTNNLHRRKQRRRSASR